MRTISAIQKAITGDSVEALGGPIAPYRSGPQLVAFFNELGEDDRYGKGFPSRWSFAESKLAAMNGTDRLRLAIEAALDPAVYLDSDLDAADAAAYLNKYLQLEGFELILANERYRLIRLGEPMVSVEAELAPHEHASHEFIAEQIEKCDRKLRDEDYDGAITNARSVVEAVLTDIEARLDPEPPRYDGELPRLYKRVSKLLNLDPSRQDIRESLQQLLRGLANIVSGLAPLRNKMGDAHVRSYKPSRRHAKLAVNAAKTLLDFVYDSFEYQRATGAIKVVGEDGES